MVSPRPSSRCLPLTMSRAPSRPKPGPTDAPAHDPNAVAATQVLRQFRSIFGAVRAHFHEVEKRAGLGGAQVWALGTIRAQPGIGVGELAAAMDVHQSTASNLVRGLLARGLISSTQRPEDRRSVALRILPAGRAVLRKVPGPVTGILPVALRELDARTLSRLQADLGRLLEHLAADDRAAQTPLAQL
jgi:MarR family transcriptional regulator, organic hydroperoxide resistance regulator